MHICTNGTSPGNKSRVRFPGKAFLFLHALPRSVWISFGYSGCLTQSKDQDIWRLKSSFVCVFVSGPCYRLAPGRLAPDCSGVPCIRSVCGHTEMDGWMFSVGMIRMVRNFFCFSLGLFDKCFYASCDRGWLVGIRPVSDQGNRDPRFYFSLKTDRAHKATTVTSNAAYAPNQWQHLAVTYNGLHMKLYVNGAQVAVSREQSGEIFSPLTKKCKVLMVGGNALNQNYRGTVEHLSLWKGALSQREIIRYMKSHGRDDQENFSQLVVHENFKNISRKWLTVKDGSFPQVGVSDRTWTGDLGDSVNTALIPPVCGQTICDNVQVVTNYNHFWNFRKPKTVRYRLVNVYDDHGRWPTVTEHQINLQHQYLNSAFGKYNITWERTVHNVFNSSLRHRLVLANCDINKVGDEECDPECNHTLTGFDAGYCRRQTMNCPTYKLGNGVCDPECNWDNYYYDKGDCCNSSYTDVTKTCFNPKSHNR